MANLKSVIDEALEKRADLSASSVSPEIRAAVADGMRQLDKGRIRVAEKKDGEWITHQWIKKAVLLSFRLRDNEIMQGGYTHFFDKVDSKFANFSQADFQ